MKAILTERENETISHPELLQMSKDSKNKKWLQDKYETQSTIGKTWLQSNDFNSTIYYLLVSPQRVSCIYLVGPQIILRSLSIDLLS